MVTAPQAGTDDQGTTVAVVELKPKTAVSKVVAAVEGVKTPHASRVAPAVTEFTALRIKPTATREQIMDALRKANLLED